MSFLRRVSPTFLLFLFAPLVAEFVLGDLTLDQLGALFVLAPLYGGGAILIREFVCRTGAGWRAFLLPAFAYALLEEGILTQSLFNPNYLHLRLIDYGFVPALGTAIPWAIFVLTIHMVWSLAVPIGIVEAAFASRRSEPWLKLQGLVVTCLLFGGGALLALRFSFSQTRFRASALQLSLCALLISVCLAAAFLPRERIRNLDSRSAALNPAVFGATAFALGSAFQLVNSFGRANLPWFATASLLGAIIAAAVGFFVWATRANNWTPTGSWSAATGGLLCYVWLGYTVDRALHGPGHALGHSVFVAAALLVTAWAGWRAVRHDGFSKEPAVSEGQAAANG
ncbi:MAG TPA: hypothetical protein VF776_09390 [Sphingomicrobium sp.]